MTEDKNNNNNESQPAKKTEKKAEKAVSLTRRDVVKGLATIPVFGPFLYAFFRKKWLDDLKK